MKSKSIGRKKTVGNKKSIKERKLTKKEQANISIGLKAEDVILKKITKKYPCEKITPNKNTFDGGIPDLKYTKNGQDVYVEVKSIHYSTKDGRGRAQFLRSEIQELSNRGGKVIFEVRKGVYSYYYLANALDVWNYLKNESGDELKLEYNQITSFEKFDINKL